MEMYKLNGLVTARVIKRMFTMYNIKKYNKLTGNKTLCSILYIINHNSNIFMIDFIWPVKRNVLQLIIEISLTISSLTFYDIFFLI